MKRLLSTIRLDVIVQLRNKLYVIGVSVAVILAVLLSQLAEPVLLPRLIPVIMLMVIGGSTLMYVSGMILFERDEGTINAIIVSPLRTWEYLWSKIITLTALSTLESSIMVGGAMLIMSFSTSVPIPNIPALLLGIAAIGMVYTHIGILLVVRYQSITDFLIPMAAVVVPLQLPFLHFLGVVEHPLFLLVPTSAQVMLMMGAFSRLAPWEWMYAIGYTAVSVALLTWRAGRAFRLHVIMNAR